VIIDEPVERKTLGVVVVQIWVGVSREREAVLDIEFESVCTRDLVLVAAWRFPLFGLQTGGGGKTTDIF